MTTPGRRRLALVLLLLPLLSLLLVPLRPSLRAEPRPPAPLSTAATHPPTTAVEAVQGLSIADPTMNQPPSDVPASGRRRRPSRRVTAIVVSVATVLWLAASLVVGVMVMFLPMIFDAPGSMEQPGTVTFAASVALFPPICWLAIVLAWVFFALHRPVASLLSTGLPLLPLAVAAGAWGWIDVVQKGNLGTG